MSGTEEGKEPIDPEIASALAEEKELGDVEAQVLAVRGRFDARQIVRETPPQWSHGHKRAIYGGGGYVVNRKRAYFQGACPRGSRDFSGEVDFSRWRMMPLPKTLDSKRPLKVDIRPDIYMYDEADVPEDEPNAVEFYVNFADADLFNTYGDKLLDQDELMVLEHPVLASLREVLLVHQSEARLLNTTKVMTETKKEIAVTTLSPVCDTPCVILGAQRHVRVNMYPDKKGGIPRGLMGVEFNLATRSQVLSNSFRLSEPTVTNVICMAAGTMGVGAYTLAQVRSLLATAYTAFRAARIAAILYAPRDEKDEPVYTIVHTGNWGCGASRGSAELICLIQTLAARLAGINQLVYHAVTPSRAKQAQCGYKALYGITEGTESYLVTRLLKTVLKRGYAWGSSRVVRPPLLPASAHKKINPKPPSPRVPSQKPPPGAPRSSTLEVKGHFFFRPGSWACMWGVSPFRVGRATYVCAGQYLMANKARIFGDIQTLEAIMAERKSPLKIMKLAASIKGLGGELEKTWDEQQIRVANEALVAKFAQDVALRNKLIRTGENTLVYASVKDEVWGNGLDFPYQDDQRALDRKQWRGKNLLGAAMERARSWVLTLGSPSGGCTVKQLEQHFITVDEILQFCFPESILFPNSTDRLFMIADLGPLFHLQNRFTGLCEESVRSMEKLRHSDPLAKRIFRGEAFTYEEIKDAPWITDEDKQRAAKNVSLKGGPGNESILTNSDIKELAAAMVRYDIMRVYECPKTLSLEEQLEIIKNIPKHKRRRDNMKKTDVVALFDTVYKDEAGRIEFKTFREIVRKLRDKWIAKTKMMFPPVDPKPKPFLSGYQSSNLATRLVGKKLPDTLTWMVTDRLIHKTMAQISALEDHGEGTAFRNNVHLMRNTALTDTETNWDPYCCIRNTKKGTYVKKPRAAKDR